MRGVTLSRFRCTAGLPGAELEPKARGAASFQRTRLQTQRPRGLGRAQHDACPCRTGWAHRTLCGRGNRGQARTAAGPSCRRTTEPAPPQNPTQRAQTAPSPLHRHTMLASTSRGALPAASRPKQLPLRSLAAAASPAAALGRRSSVAARLAQQLRELKQFKVRWTFRVCCPGYALVLPVLLSCAQPPCQRPAHAPPPLAPCTHTLANQPPAACRSGMCRQHLLTAAPPPHAEGASCGRPARPPPVTAARGRVRAVAAGPALSGSGATCACMTTRP